MIDLFEHRPTPFLTRHARERCAEMGISTKVAKRIVQHPDIIRPGNNGTACLVAVSDRYPEYAVVYDPEAFRIVTVVFRTAEVYVREGATCRIV